MIGHQRLRYEPAGAHALDLLRVECLDVNSGSIVHLHAQREGVVFSCPQLDVGILTVLAQRDDVQDVAGKGADLLPARDLCLAIAQVPSACAAAWNVRRASS